MILLGVAVLTLWACGGSNEQANQPVEPDTVAAESKASSYYLGEPRDDVQRFFGIYGDPNAPDAGRGQFFVTEAKRPRGAEQAPEIPRGYLAIGAMWADVAPMSMMSLSDSTFQQVDISDFAPAEPAVVEFEFGSEGKATGLTFTTGFQEFRHRVRIGELPEGW